jgi:hypothetical protein
LPRYGNYKVLLDDPAERPALGYTEYAHAFSDIILRSRPQFAIGIFGDWGSGKTTLMRAIWRELERPDVVRVWFNPWRYEREEHLIVPMLDTLREALFEWAEARTAGVVQSRARRAAEKVGRAARALATGLSLRAQVPLGVVGLEASFDPSKVMAAFDEKEAAEEPSSFYHASFNAMSTAFDEFVAGGVRRIVIFVDDLDRCLPLNALEVLESMKLFFDMEGFVFVVGLDQRVIERSIELKYAAPPSARGDGQPTENGATQSGDLGAAPVSGADYVKKIFQVPFGLPRISTAELPAYFSSLVASSGMPVAQASDFRKNVRPHLQYLSGAASVNPREVKRLLNAYTIQMKMLAARAVQGGPNPHVVLALQTMSFRQDWRHLYERLVADPQRFIADLRQAIGPGQGNAPVTVGFPREFVAYVQGIARPLLLAQLEPYITSVETTRSSDPALLEAQGVVSGLIQRTRDVTTGPELVEVISEFHGAIEHLADVVRSGRRKGRGGDLLRLADRLATEVRNLNPDMTEEALNAWAVRAREILEAMDEDIRILRRESSVGATA